MFPLSEFGAARRGADGGPTVAKCEGWAEVASGSAAPPAPGPRRATPQSIPKGCQPATRPTPSIPKGCQPATRRPTPSIPKGCQPATRRPTPSIPKGCQPATRRPTPSIPKGCQPATRRPTASIPKGCQQLAGGFPALPGHHRYHTQTNPCTPDGVPEPRTRPDACHRVHDLTTHDLASKSDNACASAFSSPLIGSRRCVVR